MTTTYMGGCLLSERLRPYVPPALVALVRTIYFSHGSQRLGDLSFCAQPE